jgi:hypothetical protein
MQNKGNGLSCGCVVVFLFCSLVWVVTRRWPGFGS